MESCAVGIFSDNFDARCIAHICKKMDRLKEWHKELICHGMIPMKFPFCITCQIVKNNTPYTKAEQFADKEQANQIYQDEEY